VVRLRLHRVRGQVRERIARAVGRDLGGDRFERGRIPEEIQEAVAAALAGDKRRALDGDDHPRQHRHDDQDHEQRLADHVALRDEVAEAEACIGRL
jgi:hypothetical protein